MQRLKLANSNLVHSLDLPRTVIKSHPEEKWVRPWARGSSPKILGYPFNIFVTAEASDLKFGTQLGFAMTHHKITRRGKVGAALG